MLRIQLDFLSNTNSDCTSLAVFECVLFTVVGSCVFISHINHRWLEGGPSLLHSYTRPAWYILQGIYRLSHGRPHPPRRRFPVPDPPTNPWTKFPTASEEGAIHHSSAPDPSVSSSRKTSIAFGPASDSLLHPRTRNATCRVCERGISTPSPALVLFLIPAFMSLYSGLQSCFQSSSISSIQSGVLAGLPDYVCKPYSKLCGQ